MRSLSQNRLPKSQPHIDRTIRSVMILPIHLFLVAATLGQTPESQIKKMLSDQVEAWNRGSIEEYMAGYWNSDSTVFISGGVVSRGYGTLLDRYKRTYSSRDLMGRLVFSDLTVRLISDAAAVAFGKSQLERSADQPWGRFTLILERKKEGWRITHDHTSVGQ